MQLGFAEIVVIAVVALLVLGPERLPDAARRVGAIYGELRKLQGVVQTQIDSAMREADLAAAAKRTEDGLDHDPMRSEPAVAPDPPSTDQSDDADEADPVDADGRVTPDDSRG